MKNYDEVLLKFETFLTAENWPKTLWVDPEMYWAMIIASEGKILPAWRFHPTGEDEGFPYFLIGPTMVRPVKQTRTAVLSIHPVVKEFNDARKQSEKTS